MDQICPKGHCLASRGPVEGHICPFEGHICPFVPNSNDRFFFLPIFVPTLELITILP